VRPTETEREVNNSSHRTSRNPSETYNKQTENKRKKQFAQWIDYSLRMDGRLNLRSERRDPLDSQHGRQDEHQQRVPSVSTIEGSSELRDGPVRWAMEDLEGTPIGGRMKVGLTPVLTKGGNLRCLIFCWIGSRQG
jgi:hypothetical protein